MPLSSISIVYQDHDLLVVNKPTLLLSVPGRAENNKDCLIQRLNQNGYPDALIVHRLDWETTGLMVLARNAAAHSELSRQFRERLVARTYTALCWGQLAAQQGQIELPMRYDPPNKPRQTLDFMQGKTARTYWRKLSTHESHTRVELSPHTGRSHQLRVHLNALGHPILGDPLYAHNDALNAAPRLCLHAATLSFYHPANQQPLSFHCPAEF
ncbi:MAG: RluA family pseudouridine synthase [Thiopseudomonas sp.]|nr:RluA family pseudouridine synthase [Thiopseudomonas sp.]MCK9465012.1 RluA family pseudouridine synthase [Thiopseudomonas sp.]